MARKQYSVRLDEEFAQRLDAYAARQVRDASNVIEICVLKVLPELEAAEQSLLLTEPKAKYRAGKRSK